MLHSELSIKMIENVDSAHFEAFFILWHGCCGRALSDTSSGNHHKYDSITLVKPEDLGDVQGKKDILTTFASSGLGLFLLSSH